MAPTAGRPGWVASPVWLVLAGIASVQLGAGIAKSLFDEVAPTTIVWLRLVTSAVVLLAAARPGWPAGPARTGWWWAASASRSA
jgi:inner membrane transporter RhtA